MEAEQETTAWQQPPGATSGATEFAVDPNDVKTETRLAASDGFGEVRRANSNTGSGLAVRVQSTEPDV